MGLYKNWPQGNAPGSFVHQAMPLDSQPDPLSARVGGAEQGRTSGQHAPPANKDNLRAVGNSAPSHIPSCRVHIDSVDCNKARSASLQVCGLQFVLPGDKN